MSEVLDLRTLPRGTLGSAIRQLRYKSSTSQATLAKAIKRTPAALSRIETGDSVPSEETVRLLCWYFDCSLSDLVAAARNSQPPLSRRGRPRKAASAA